MIVDPYGSVVAQTSDMQPYKPTFCLADIVSSSCSSPPPCSSLPDTRVIPQTGSGLVGECPERDAALGPETDGPVPSNSMGSLPALMLLLLYTRIYTSSLSCCSMHRCFGPLLREPP